VFKGLNRLLLVALVAGAALIAPSAALACNGGPSAVNVYKECLAAGGGDKPTNPAPPSSQPGPSSTPVTSGEGANSLHAGKDSRTLYALVKGAGASKTLPPSSSESATSPSALGSAFDLGSGPTALLAALAGTALLLLGANGLRFWRSRRASR
jgi:hypothetical protein